MIPTDLSSFLDLLLQHGDAAYTFLFAYAASHSLLFGLFAGYAAFAGALKVSTAPSTPSRQNSFAVSTSIAATKT